MKHAQHVPTISARRRRRSAFTVFLAIVLYPVGQSVLAWEEDTHFVLTFWLATQAGFSRQNADIIAQGNQSYDDSAHRAAIHTVLWIILSGDQGAARELQLKHFPSDAPIPSPALRRVVQPNSADARRLVLGAIQAGESSTALTSLGEAFHPFQDSWSHQGVPDVPFNLRSSLISGHPVARGGWRSHNADLTHLHAGDVLDMARETHALLRRYLAAHPNLRAHSGREWSSLLPIVRQFAEAKTQNEKRAWATKYVPDARTAAEVLTLPGEGSNHQVGVSEVRSVEVSNTKPETANEESQGLWDAISQFHRDWLRRASFDDAVGSIDLGDIAKQLVSEPAIRNQDDVRDWCKKFLASYLFPDHSVINALGHGNPVDLGYRRLPPTPNARFESRPVELIAVAREHLYEIDLDGTKAYGLILSFSKLPHDQVSVMWQRRGTTWRIVRMHNAII